MNKNAVKTGLLAMSLLAVLVLGVTEQRAMAGEADIQLPNLFQVHFKMINVGGPVLMYVGLAVCVIGLLFGLVPHKQI
jgi:K(+)-stimulated pyrophosphate-energized sodium pump